MDQLLQRLWRSRGGYGIEKAEESAIIRAGEPTANTEERLGRRPATYGEVTATGVRQIGRAMGADNLTLGVPVIFMDLGMGVGKFVAQAHLEWPAVARSIGVELSRSRVERARGAWAEAVASGEAEDLRAAAVALAGGAGADAPWLSGAVHFVEADLFEADVAEVTHVYVASLCFSDSMLLRLARKLAAEAHRLQVVAALRRFPLGILGFETGGNIQAQMTWTAASGGGQTVYLYRRRADAQPEL